MAKLKILRGTTSKLVHFYVRDASRTDNGGLTGLTSTSGQLATPVNSGFSTATTGGSLTAATYFYRVSALNSAGETLASTETSQVVPAGTSTNTVTVNWAAVTGATGGYKVYGRTTGAELLIASVAAGTTTYVDTGSITPSGALPGANTTVLINCWYLREGDATTTQIVLGVGVVGTWSIGGFKEVDATHMAGLYEVGLPNAALSGGNSVKVFLQGAANMVTEPVELELDGINYATGQVDLDMAQILATPPTTTQAHGAPNTITVGYALWAAVIETFGAERRVGTAYTKALPDNSADVRAFTLNDPTAITSRT